MAILGVPISRAHFPNQMEMNLRISYIDRYSNLPKMYPKLYTVRDTDLSVEREVINASYGTFALKPEGDAAVTDAGQEAWAKAYRPKTYALETSVTMEAIEDDPHGVVKHLTDKGGALADASVYTQERDAMDVFNNLSDTLYTADGSNYTLLSTAQYRVDGGTWSNRPTSDMDLGIEALELGVSHWVTNQVNQRGQILMVTPSLLLVGGSDGILADRLVNSRQRPQSADNDINSVGKVINDVLVHPLLTNDGRWFLLADQRYRKASYYMKKRPTVKRMPDQGSTGNSVFLAYYRAAWGMTSPEGVFGSA